MWLNSTAQNALQAVLHLAELGGSVPVRVGDIATALGVPRNYLSKTMHILAREGILVSTRGPRGGFALAGFPRPQTDSRARADASSAREKRRETIRATQHGRADR